MRAADLEKIFNDLDAKHPVDKRLNPDETMEVLVLEERRVAEQDASRRNDLR